MVTEVYLTDGTLIASIAVGTANTVATSIALFGDNYADYGRQAAENWVHILENFANTSSPSNPLTGQLWYDKSSGSLKVWTGSSYDTVSTTELTSSSINDFLDVNTAGVSNGDVLKWNGTQWVPGTDESGGGGGTPLPSGANGQILVSNGTDFLPSTNWVTPNSMTIQSNGNISIVAGFGASGSVGLTGTFVELTPSSGGHVDINEGNLRFHTPGDAVRDGVITANILLLEAQTEIQVNGKKVRNAADPTVASDLATKGYVDTTVAGLSGGATTLNALTDVNTSGAVNGNVLKFDGSNWVPGTDNTGAGLPSATQGQILVADGGGSYVSTNEWIHPTRAYISSGSVNLDLIGSSNAVRLRAGNEGAAGSTLMSFNTGSGPSLKYVGIDSTQAGLNLGNGTASFVTHEGTINQNAVVIGVDTDQNSLPRNDINLRHYQPAIVGGGTGTLYTTEALISFGVNQAELWLSNPSVTNKDTMHLSGMKGGLQVPRGTNTERLDSVTASARQTRTSPGTYAGANIRDTLGVIRWNTQATGGTHATGALEIAVQTNAGTGSGYEYIATSVSVPDYAEFFETFDGSALPVGSTVKMDTVNPGYVLAAQPGDESLVFGVVRPKNVNSMVLGDYQEWPGKYAMDDYNGYVVDVDLMRYVKIEILDGDENVINVSDRFIKATDDLPSGTNIRTTILREFEQETRIVNPNYDDSQIYVGRRQRPEWQIVGIMGQIPVTKGQPVNPNWILMKEVSPTVDMYLVK